MCVSGHRCRLLQVLRLLTRGLAAIVLSGRAAHLHVWCSAGNRPAFAQATTMTRLSLPKYVYVCERWKKNDSSRLGAASAVGDYTNILAIIHPSCVRHWIYAKLFFFVYVYIYAYRAAGLHWGIQGCNTGWGIGVVTVNGAALRAVVQRRCLARCGDSRGQSKQFQTISYDFRPSHICSEPFRPFHSLSDSFKTRQTLSDTFTYELFQTISNNLDLDKPLNTFYGQCHGLGPHVKFEKRSDVARPRALDTINEVGGQTNRKMWTRLEEQQTLRRTATDKLASVRVLM